MRTAVLCLALAAVSIAPRFAAAEAAPADRHAFEKELAFGGDGESAPADARTPSAWGAFASFVGYALVLVLLVAGLVVVARKAVPGARRFGPSSAIEVLGRRALAPNAQVFLVQVGRRVLTVGVGKEGVTSLAETADPDEVALIRGQCLGTEEKSAFRETLAAKAPPEPAPAPETPEPQPASSVKDELEAIRKVVNGWRASA